MTVAEKMESWVRVLQGLSTMLGSLSGFSKCQLQWGPGRVGIGDWISLKEQRVADKMSFMCYFPENSSQGLLWKEEPRLLPSPQPPVPSLSLSPGQNMGLSVPNT